MQHVCRQVAIFHFWRRVPRRLRERLGGKAEICRSLETSSPREAGIRSRLLFLESERLFAARDKWTILVLSLLAIAQDNRLRFSEIKSGIHGISQRMLTTTLRNLERDGLLTRHYFPEVPPRVEHELTEMGRGLLPALEGLTGWIRTNWTAIEAARKEYDARRDA